MAHILAYHLNQTYDEGLKLETLEEEFKHHFPYFVLERLAYSTVSTLSVFSLKTVIPIPLGCRLSPTRGP